VSGVIRLFRLDVAAWERVSGIGTMASAAATALGAFAFFAFDRFGFQAFIAPRATMRMLLVGLYGWLGLAVVALLIARRTRPTTPAFGEVLRIYGYAHLPLLLLAFTIQIIAVVARALGPSFVFAVFVVAIWLPASLVAATRYVFDVSLPQAIGIIAAPYALWVALVGSYLWRQVGHLL